MKIDICEPLLTASRDKGNYFFRKYMIFYSNKYIYPYATIIAGIPLYKVAIMAAFGAKAIAGNNASPSLAIALPISADRGM